MTEPLRVLHGGAVTAVGLSVSQTCAAIRANVSGFAESAHYHATRGFDAIVVAQVKLPSLPDEVHLPERLEAMATQAIQECLPERVPPERIALLVGVGERWHSGSPRALKMDRLLPAIERSLGLRFSPASCVLPEGKAACFSGLLQARALLASGTVEGCIVGGVDSFVNVDDMRQLEETYRLKGPEVAQGLIPGEGASFIYVTSRRWADDGLPLCEIIGLGVKREVDEATVLSNGHPTGRGLQRALEAAIADAPILESEIDFRISDLNGESFSGIESLIAMTRVYRTRRERFELWHAADCIGETGAASGALMVILAAAGMAGGYAPGTIAMCEAASDSGLRAGCVIRAPQGLCPEAAQRPVSIDDDRLAWRQPKSKQQPVLPEVLSQFAEEAGFLWSLRERQLRAPHVRIHRLTELDLRIEAHLKGLLDAGEAGERILDELFDESEPGATFTAAWLAFRRGNLQRIASLLEKNGGALDRARGLVAALGWIPWPHAEPHIKRLLKADPSLRGVGIAACALHRQHPGQPLHDAFGSSDRNLIIPTLEAIGLLGLTSLRPLLRPFFDASDSLCRYHAAYAATLLSDPLAAELLFESSLTDAPVPEEALSLALRRLRPSTASSRWLELSQRPQFHRLAVVGAGALGDPERIPWLLDRLGEPGFSRIAGDAIAMITGVELEAAGLAVDEPGASQAGSLPELDESEPLFDQDADLPWPEPQLCERWWHEQNNAYLRARYLAGHPVEPEGLKSVLLKGYQHQRWAAAQELMPFESGKPLFNVEAPGWRQRM